MLNSHSIVTVAHCCRSRPNKRKSKLKMWLLFALRFLFICIILHCEFFALSLFVLHFSSHNWRETHTHTHAYNYATNLWSRNRKKKCESDGTFSCSFIISSVAILCAPHFCDIILQIISLINFNESEAVCTQTKLKAFSFHIAKRSERQQQQHNQQ